METRYIIIEWPESQELMDHPRFDECFLLEQTDKIGSSTYAVPEDLYNEIYGTVS